MIRLLTLTILLGFATCATALGQPHWDCLFEGTFEEATALEGRQRIILVLADTRTEYDYWDRWALATPEAAEWVEKRGFRVVFEDISQNNTISYLTQPAVLPAVIVFNWQGREIGRRYGQRSSDTTEVFTEWADSLFGIPLQVALANELEIDPTNIELRFRLIDELGRAGMEIEQLDHLAWLLDHNDLFANYSKARRDDQSKLTLDESERAFRYELLWIAGALHEPIGQLTRRVWHESGGYLCTPPPDGWNLAFKFIDSKPGSRSRAQQDQLIRLTPIVQLRRILELRRDSGTATERDLFVLATIIGDADE